MIDFEKNMLVVRNSLYYPALDQNDQRIINVSLADTLGSSFVSTLPAGAGLTSGTTYNNQALLYKITQSITP